MNTKHTPGPWAVNWAGSGKNGQFVYDEAFVYAPACGVDDVAIAADIVDPLTGKPSGANARLIAAAPELLTVCASWIQHMDGIEAATQEKEDWLLDAMRAAVAKATGETA